MNDFKNRIKYDNMSKQETIVVSDIHGDIKKWNSIRDKLIINPSLKVVILGDAMDRGNDSLRILLQIKEMSDNGRVEYLPGNHDIFAYNYLSTLGTEAQNSELAREALANLEHNGGTKTIEDFANYDDILQNMVKRGELNNKISPDELMDWLGRQPVQRKIKANNINYALSHAVFDEKLYNYNKEFCLQDALLLELNNENLGLTRKEEEMLSRFENCMWYREKDSRTHFSDIAFPEGDVMVVGHTRQPEANVKYLGNDPNKPMIYIDCGQNDFQGFNLDTARHVDMYPRINDSKQIGRAM